MTDLHYFSFPIIDKNNISDSIFYCLTYNKIIENIIILHLHYFGRSID